MSQLDLSEGDSVFDASSSLLSRYSRYSKYKTAA